MMSNCCHATGKRQSRGQNKDGDITVKRLSPPSPLRSAKYYHSCHKSINVILPKSQKKSSSTQEVGWSCFKPPLRNYKLLENQDVPGSQEESFTQEVKWSSHKPSPSPLRRYKYLENQDEVSFYSGSLNDKISKLTKMKNNVREPPSPVRSYRSAVAGGRRHNYHQQEGGVIVDTGSERRAKSCRVQEAVAAVRGERNSRYRAEERQNRNERSRVDETIEWTTYGRSQVSGREGWNENESYQGAADDERRHINNDLNWRVQCFLMGQPTTVPPSRWHNSGMKISNLYTKMKHNSTRGFQPMPREGYFVDDVTIAGRKRSQNQEGRERRRFSVSTNQKEANSFSTSQKEVKPLSTNLNKDEQTDFGLNYYNRESKDRSRYLRYPPSPILSVQEIFS